ncbi:MAG: M43 family zinc metalloprotease [Chryseobacterium sp.]|uniref:M43 family zinc metalloprotease n=1 Tax=Chryseobacterium sp. TaxID=1871047 RepID=UPI0025B92437|nr:M43 family zinc metalloprotease [Chryseobacterium sp.]MCJ7933469.1 M43 family zinc metalloprotease [Chryseobacterium sp.]
MRKSTTSKALFLLPLLWGGIGSAQVQTGTEITKKKTSIYVKKSPEELAKTFGFDRCSTVEYEKYLQAKNPKRLTDEQFEAWLAPLVERAKTNKSQNGDIITIPVVVHVIHSGQNVGVAPNIVDEQVMSQIAVMNNDYRKILNTPGYNVNPVGADTQIQFVLAKVDPNGNPTNGIDRVNLCQDNWSQDDIDAVVKPQTIWDPTKYMNMWSVNFADASLLGYAQFPSNSTLAGLDPNMGDADTDGVVANFATFGSSDYNTNNTFLLGAPYDKGRTMTHEVGHFLGLRHIWGDANCGTDYCADTPTHRTSNGGCPAHPKSNTCGTADEMFENYMDYTYDTCMNIFTNDQKTRITTVMNNSPRRMELKTSVADLPIPLFPNDAELKIDGGCALGNCGGGLLRFSLYNRGTSNLTAATISYSFNGGPAQSYNWTGSLAQDKFSMISIPVNSTIASSPVTASIASVNGGADQRSTNNTVTGNYVKPVTPDYIPSATTVTFKLQRDYFGTETMWTLKNSAGQIVKSGGPYADVANPTTTTPLPALITQSWTLPLDCYVFTISDAYGDGLGDGGYVDVSTSTGVVIYHGSTNINSYATKAFTNQVLGTSETAKKDNFGIYPNPVSDVLNISKVSHKATFEIYNAVGQIVKKGTIDNNKVNVSELLRGNYVITISDNAISESFKFIKK